MASKVLERAFRLYNRKYFGNSLPNPPEICLRWKKLPAGLMGYQCEDEIVMSHRYRYEDKLWQFTLLHEMVHLSLPKAAAHGKQFDAAMLRLAKIGAFKGLW